MPNPWFRDGLRFTCTQCGDCCRSHGEYKWVFLDPADVTRLATAKGMTNAAFLREFCDRDEDGISHTLKWPDEACVFLGRGNGGPEAPRGSATGGGTPTEHGQTGCTVYDARPAQCRTWPFWPENLTKKVWDTEIVPFCPGAGEGRLYSIGEIRRLAKNDGETGKLPDQK